MRIVVAISFLLAIQVCVAQDCSTRAAAKPAVVVKWPDVYINDTRGSAASVAKMKQQLAKAENWTKNMLTGFTGAKLQWSNEFWFDYKNTGSHSDHFYRATGISSSYSFMMRFFAYYCYDSKEVIHTEGESGSFVKVIFNNVFIGALCSDVGTFTINGHPVFTILEKSHSQGRTDVYDFRSKSTIHDTVYTSKHDIILLRNSDKPVFITVARKEYLEYLLKDIDVYSMKQKMLLTEMYDARQKQFENEVKVYKQYDKTYTSEKEAAQRKKFQETNNPTMLDKDIKKMEAEMNKSRDVIRQYLQKPPAWLECSVSQFYFSSYTAAGFKQYFDELDNFRESKNDRTRTEVVYINPEYFNRTPSSDIPQLIIVHLQKKAYPHMLKVSRLVKQIAALAPLEALLRKQ
jgi:hypothetical protein